MDTDRGSFIRKKEIETIAMYLPQFHRTAENDEWWGEGFTDWTTVRKAEPLRADHIQPRKPLGGDYYDLLEKDVMMRQARLAEEYGVDGFCFYHYRFGLDEEGGNRLLLEKPAENLLGWTDVPMRFCFCWANETWARTWSAVEGANSWAAAYEPERRDDNGREILIEQEYGTEESWKKHFEYLLPFFKDDRYIRKDGRPLFLIYKPELIGCLDEMITCFRSLAKEEGLEGIYVIGLNMTEKVDCLDAALIAAPGGYMRYDLMDMPPEGGQWDDCSVVWERGLKAEPVSGMKTYYGAFAGYDDSPRRGKKGLILSGNSPEVFGKYLPRMMRKNIAAGNDIQFINAWNEWGEGNMLEPDELFGYGFLEAVRRSVQGEEYLTEKKYALHHFEDRFAFLKDREIWLYGTGANASAMFEGYGEEFGISGFVSADCDYGDPDGKTGRKFMGRPVISTEDLIRRGREAAVIIAANIKSCFEIYERDGAAIKSAGIDVYSMYGNDMAEIFSSVRGAKVMSDESWEKLFSGYDVISFDLLDTFLYRDVFDEGGVYVPPLMKRLLSIAQRDGRKMVFVSEEFTSEGCPLITAEKQAETLKAAGIDDAVIYDAGETGCGKADGLFRIMALRNEGAQILHIGNDLLYDVFAPRMYGIDTFGYGEGFASYAENSNYYKESDEKRQRPVREEVLKEVDESDVISFDIFGTLLSRTDPDPEYVMYAACERAKEAGLPAAELAALRIEAQQRLEEPTIDEIYTEMGRLAGPESGLGIAALDQLKEMEIAKEKEMLVPRRPVVDLLGYAKEQGKEVVLTSDMYLTAEVIHDILSHFDIDIDEKDIFVSCEYRKRKAAGLFDEVIRSTGEDSHSGLVKLLHIGDSPEHDHLPAVKAGAKSILIDNVWGSAASSWTGACAYALREAGGGSFAGRIISALYADPFHEPKKPEEAVAAAAMFTVWLMTYPQIRELDGLLFASRDGYILKKVYDLASEESPGEDLPPTIYFHVSRKAAAALKDEQDTRGYFLSYAESLGLKTEKRYGFIDFYAAGSIQRMLSDICPFRLEGLYFGVNEANPAGEVEIRSLLGSGPVSFAEEYIAFEKIFSSPEPSVAGYDSEGPVFAAEDRTVGELIRFESDAGSIICKAFEYIKNWNF